VAHAISLAAPSLREFKLVVRESEAFAQFYNYLFAPADLGKEPPKQQGSEATMGANALRTCAACGLSRPEAKHKCEPEKWFGKM
jgi:hypothetical protein